MPTKRVTPFLLSPSEVLAKGATWTPVATAKSGEGALLSVTTMPQISEPGSVAQRWAMLVLRGCESEKDLRTLGEWARSAGVSYSTLCETCRLLRIQPKEARDFMRILRILLRYVGDSLYLETLLNVNDRRTLQAILSRAGLRTLSNDHGHLRPLEFLNVQQFVSRDNEGLRVLAQCLLPTSEETVRSR